MNPHKNNEILKCNSSTYACFLFKLQLLYQQRQMSFTREPGKQPDIP